MTVDELAIELGVSTHYIEHHFPRIKQSWEKRGIKLIKNGKGKNVNYGVLKQEEINVRYETIGRQL